MSNDLSGVVVGVDAGPAGDAALELAADLAARHQKPLLLLHVLKPPMATGLVPFSVDVGVWKASYEMSLNAAAADLRRRHPSIDISIDMPIGNVAATLIEASPPLILSWWPAAAGAASPSWRSARSAPSCATMLTDR
jgi:nucleotide-binding universal stress UspA family protein